MQVCQVWSEGSTGDSIDSTPRKSIARPVRPVLDPKGTRGSTGGEGRSGPARGTNEQTLVERRNFMNPPSDIRDSTEGLTVGAAP